MINSNKSCFWMFLIKLEWLLELRLTVTKVVFEFSPIRHIKWFILRLTVTKVVFEWWIFRGKSINKNKINSNKSCFWIDFSSTSWFCYFWLTVTKVVFESISIWSEWLIVLWLTVTKVVFELGTSTSTTFFGNRLTVTKVVFEWIIKIN